MKKIIPFLLLLSSAVSAQSYSDSVYRIENDFKSFKYEDVIKKSAELLSVDTIPPVLKPQLYMMKGISHFVLAQDTLAKYSFLEILRLNPQFRPDSIATSPKIIKFFNEIRDNYAWYYMPQRKLVLDTLVQVPPDEKFLRYKEKFRTAVIRSLLFPGLGHLYLDNNTGWYLAVPGGISLLSSVYYIIDTQNKRTDYLNAQDPQIINEKYKSYNISYKIRNVSIVIFSAIWLFSQFDILNTEYIDPFSPPFVMISTSPAGTQLLLRLRL